LEEKKKHFPEATMAVQRAIQINPNIPTGYASLGRLQGKLKNWGRKQGCFAGSDAAGAKNLADILSIGNSLWPLKTQISSYWVFMESIRLHPPIIFDLMQTLETPLGMGLIIFL